MSDPGPSHCRLSHFKPPAPSSFGKSKRSFATAAVQVKASLSVRRPRKLNPAEKQWFMEEENQADAAQFQMRKPPPPPGDRYDWRRIRVPPSPLNGETGTNGGMEGEISPKPRKKRRNYIRRAAYNYSDVRKGEPLYEEIERYKDHFIPSIAAEQAVHDAELRDRLMTWSLEQLQREGFCIPDLYGFDLGIKRYGLFVTQFFPGPGVPLPLNHLFTKGARITVCREHPLHGDVWKGTVLFSSDPNKIEVGFEPEDNSFLEGNRFSEGEWRLDLANTHINFERMRKAITQLGYNPDEPEKDIHNDDERPQAIWQGTQLRDIILRSFVPKHDESDSPIVPHHLQDPSDRDYLPYETLNHDRSKCTGMDEGDIANTPGAGAFDGDMRIASWARRYGQENAISIPGDPTLNGLNPTQVRAAAMMIGERISLVQGPPGTGKTRTITETVKLLKGHFAVTHPILVCTFTNVAVDNLVEGLAKAGLSPLRVGTNTDGGEDGPLHEYNLQFQFNHHPLREEYDEVCTKLKHLLEKIKDIEDCIKATQKELAWPNSKLMSRVRRMKEDRDKKEKRRERLKAKEYALYKQIISDIVHRADVVCTTCLTSVSTNLDVIDFPVVFLDEASMCTEPASLIPLMKGCRHLSLIGDHKQLPPVVLSPEAQDRGFSISLFERLTMEGVVPSIMLDIQYRMHPGISHFISAEFYQNKLLDGTFDEAGQVTRSLMPPSSSHLVSDEVSNHSLPVVFVDHAGHETRRSKSRVNRSEAFIVCSIVEDLLLNNSDLSGMQIGVIAAYASQISLLDRVLKKDLDVRANLEAVLGRERAMTMANIEIKTVDGFEGREKDVIIFSTVRNNSSGYIGFLADRRRLNVGLTRAKRALFVVGSLETLKNGRYGRISTERSQASSEILAMAKGAETWKRYAQYLEDSKLVLQLAGDEQKRVNALASSTRRKISSHPYVY